MLCRKCGRPVVRSNNVVEVQAVMLQAAALVITIDACHFLPDGICTGSPELAQYIEGQPLYNGAIYDSDREIAIRKAYSVVRNLTEF